MVADLYSITNSCDIISSLLSFLFFGCKTKIQSILFIYLQFLNILSVKNFLFYVRKSLIYLCVVRRYGAR